MFSLSRMRYLASALPIPVMTDRSQAGTAVIRSLLAQKPDVVVVDFPHAMVLMPPEPIPVPIVLFTHNVEVEILPGTGTSLAIRSNEPCGKTSAPRWRVSSSLLCGALMSSWRCRNVMPPHSLVAKGTKCPRHPNRRGSGFFSYRPPSSKPHVVFTGSMDLDGQHRRDQFLLRDVWPLVPERRTIGSHDRGGPAPATPSC